LREPNIKSMERKERGMTGLRRAVEEAEYGISREIRKGE
jgi:hypothetical protein